VLDLGDLARQAERLKAAARAQADQIIQAARDEAARIIASAEAQGLEQGRARGHAEGYQQGLEQGRTEALQQTKAELDRVREVCRQTAGELETRRQDIDRDARQAVLQFALRMAEKVVHRVIEVDETVIVDQLANALSHVLRPVDVAVRINPSDRAVLEAAMPELLAEFAQFQHVRIIDDPVIGPGGCVVTYGQGRVDATIETQMDRIVHLMLPGGTSIADESHGDEARTPDGTGANEDQS